jgi:excisionase family DNA binding protein
MSMLAKDRQTARTALRFLDREPTLHDREGHLVELPGSATAGLRTLLEALADGDDPVVIKRPRSLTTQQAADILNVSRPYLIKLINDGEIPSHNVGTHRRITFNDLLFYRDRRATEQDAALDTITAEAENLGLY